MMNPLRRLSSWHSRTWRRRPLVSLHLEELEARATPSVTVVPQSFTTNQYTALNLTQSQLLAGDSGSASLVASNPTQPGNATLVDNQNGTFTFTPNPGFTGSTTFQYTVSGAQSQLAPAPAEGSVMLGASAVSSVSIDGDTAVIGVPQTAVNGNENEGAAFVFVRSGATWTQQAELTPMSVEQFGTTVAVSGDTIVVGGGVANGNSDQGATLVFVRSGTTWTQQAQLTGANGAEAIALDGNTAAIETPNQTVDVFVRSGTIWSQQAALTPPSGFALGSQALSISGNTVVVGAGPISLPYHGSVLVYVSSGTTWSLQTTLTTPQPTVLDAFGGAVSISGDTVVVGAFNATVNGNTDQGAAYVFVRSGTTWTQQAELTAADGAAGDSLGVNVALDGDTAAVASGFKIYEFVRSGSTWSQQQEVTNFGPCSANGFGFGSLAISGNTAIIGSLTSPVSGQGAAIAQDLGLATASATVQVNSATAQLSVSPASLPTGTQGQVYPGVTFMATGGTGSSYTFQESGILPAGLTLDSATGQLTGTPTQTGTFPGIIIAASDGHGGSGSQTYTLTINHYGINGIPVPYPLSIYAPPTSKTDPNANLDAYISGLYNSILDRNVESSSALSYWENIFTTVQTGSQTNPLNLAAPAPTDPYQYVADGIWQSQEHRWDEVETYYQDFLGRTLNLNNAYNLSERQYWTNQFLFAGATEDDVIRGFLTSPEYLYDHRAEPQLANALNTNLLSGLATSQDLQTWNTDLSGLDAQRASIANQTFAAAPDYTAQLSATNLDELDNQTAKTGVLFDMLASNEYQQAALDSFYQAFLRRAGTAAEKQALLSEKDANGQPLSLGAIAALMLASPEYRTNAVNSEV